MQVILKLFLAFGLAPVAALAQGGVSCMDQDQTVEMSAKTDKHNAGVWDLRIKSGEKSRLVKKDDIARVRSNDSDFYLLFTVQSKTGPEELELDTHYVKGSGGDRKLSNGWLTNRTQKSERLPVTCKFK
jgi:hypothetical protein